jgi:hypothetical protein
MTFSTDDVGPTKRDEIVDPAIIAHCVGKVELRGDAIFVTSLQLVPAGFSHLVLPHG